MAINSEQPTDYPTGPDSTQNPEVVKLPENDETIALLVDAIKQDRILSRKVLAAAPDEGLIALYIWSAETGMMTTADPREPRVFVEYHCPVWQYREALARLNMHDPVIGAANESQRPTFRQRIQKGLQGFKKIFPGLDDGNRYS